jgi:two-component system, NtrC family, nitrogen regulation response regulator GlnG
MTRSTETRGRDTGQVVVVEDDRDFRNLVVSQLRRSGYDVVSLPDGFAAAEYIASAQIRGRQPAAVISDVCMPGFSGVSLLEAIREAHWTSPVILMTGFGLVEREKAERLEAVAVLSKPFEMTELQAVLATAVATAEEVRP